ncbi:hypothetical protein [Bradyrhizobium embrapense]|uniref:hypothetical protein n=1 Tax=Bradyrhizobium embrapense TaxID=630921 RepID=UPI0012F4A748|nr:hypothetical protein [Bradyrhizobium embrapense]
MAVNLVTRESSAVPADTISAGITEQVAILYSDGSFNVLGTKRDRARILAEARDQCADANLYEKRPSHLARVVLVEVLVKRDIPEDEK